jgi:hypothetical protein
MAVRFDAEATSGRNLVAATIADPLRAMFRKSLLVFITQIYWPDETLRHHASVRFFGLTHESIRVPSFEIAERHPSLNPSSTRIRGSGFFTPCDLKSVSQDSRGTTSIRTGLPRSLVNIAAIWFGVMRVGPSNHELQDPKLV